MINIVKYSAKECECGVLVNFRPVIASGSNPNILKKDLYVLNFSNELSLPSQATVDIDISPARYTISNNTNFQPQVSAKIKSSFTGEIQSLIKLNIKDTYNTELYTDYVKVVCSPEKSLEKTGSYSAGVGPNGGSIINVNTLDLEEGMYVRDLADSSRLSNDTIILGINNSQSIEITPAKKIAVDTSVNFEFIRRTDCSLPITNQSTSYIILDRNNNWTHQINGKTLIKFNRNDIDDNNIFITLSNQNKSKIPDQKAKQNIPSVAMVKSSGIGLIVNKIGELIFDNSIYNNEIISITYNSTLFKGPIEQNSFVVAPTPPPSRTPTPTPTPSITPTISITPSVTRTSTPTPSITRTSTPTPSITPTLTRTPTVTPSSVTPTPTPSITATPTRTPTVTPSSVTPTPTPSITATSTSTPTVTPSSVTPTPTLTRTPTVTPSSATPTPTPSITATSTCTPTLSITPTITLTPTITATATPTSTITPTSSVSATPTPTPSITPTITPTTPYFSQFKLNVSNTTPLTINLDSTTGYVKVIDNLNNTTIYSDTSPITLSAGAGIDSYIIHSSASDGYRQGDISGILLDNQSQVSAIDLRDMANISNFRQSTNFSISGMPNVQVSGFPVSNILASNGYIRFSPNNPTNSFSYYTLPSYPSTNWSSMAYGNNTFIAIASNSDKIAKSSNGHPFNYTEISTGYSRLWQRIIFANNTFVAIPYNSNISLSSVNGSTWTAGNLPGNLLWKDITYGGGLFLAIAFDSDVYATSPDGINWTSRTLPSSRFSTAATYGGGAFMIFAQNTSNVLRSTNGIDWTQHNLLNGNLWNSAAHGNNTTVVIAPGTSSLNYSTNTTDWNVATIENNNWNKVAFINNQFIIIGETTLYLTSSDGITWTQRSISNAGSWIDIASQ